MDEGLEYPTDSQLKDCWSKIDKLEIGQTLKTKDHAPNKPKLWIKCCQMYFDCYRNIKFRDDYSELKKIPYKPTFQEINEQFKTYEK